LAVDSIIIPAHGRVECGDTDDREREQV
jgi:hypothetical protein